MGRSHYPRPWIVQDLHREIDSLTTQTERLKLDRQSDSIASKTHAELLIWGEWRNQIDFEIGGLQQKVAIAQARLFAYASLDL
ncbi:hypothetical protein AMR42_14375 [Limnothrix sp. PR1529]|nr:hypothetical protein BCR12_05810 [Limnothrix sp. P13C2]PIB07308.1 hypothetical protein AMR42_14375 [Limnothrix sp. PR1529]